MMNDKHLNKISNAKLMLLPSEGVYKYSTYQLSGGFFVVEKSFMGKNSKKFQLLIFLLEIFPTYEQYLAVSTLDARMPAAVKLLYSVK